MAMALEDAFNRWRDGEFSDDETSEFTGLTPRALRDLAKWGAIETSGGEKGRGKRRAWKRAAICKAAMTGAFHKAGLPLPMAGRIAFYVWNISPNSSNDPMLRFPKWEELGKPILDTAAREPGEHAVKKWLTDDFAAPRHDDDFDSYVHIVNRSYVVAEAAVVPSYRRMFADQSDPDLNNKLDAMLRENVGGTFEELLTVILGRISDDSATFYTWHRPRRKRFFNAKERARWEKAKAEGVDIMVFMKSLGPEHNYMEEQYSDEISLDFLQYQLEPEANTEKAANAFFNFAVKTSVNVTLAMRMAMRRAMSLPVIEL